MLLLAQGSKSKITLFVVVAAVLTSGCSSGSDAEGLSKEQKGVPAHEICDGTLDTSAAAALKRISGTNRFEELTGTNQAGEPDEFSVSRSVKHLHDEYLKQSECSVYKAGDGSGKPLFEVRFSASGHYPSGKSDSSDRKVRYPLGVFAQVGLNGADLFFRCTTKASTSDAYIGDTDYVKAQMYTATNRLRGGDKARDIMVILNSMARSVAEAAGCAPQAGLPTRVPDAV
ncbi:MULTISPECIES: hypothetical protein [unclassified Streptomyces]|uniref:hypothetical protein n=1 Tax=unclassified Streptomyces TaxID=2593676 RepID=UPI00116110AC|nr:hypothetical protein [Streptomyces sp. TSRI0107]